MSKTTSSGGGIGFCSLLTIAFIVLKLCDVIQWSWWWVLSPLWISAGLAMLCSAIQWSWWWVLSPLRISAGLAISIVIFIFIGLILYGIFNDE